ncbi:MAG: ATP-dependent zinc metalloprotease FtsH [Capsulimonadaceae bacterium]|nr:ATP-dependent zinc metalloprotease FtsH [Capsulimonadaceae bacterium]
MNRILKFFLPIACLGLMLYFISAARPSGNTWFKDQPAKMDYSKIVTEIQADRVISGEFDKDTFDGKLTDSARSVEVDLPPWDNGQKADELSRILTAHKVPYKYDHPFLSDGAQSALFSILVPGLLIIVFWMFFLRQAQAGGNQAMSFGRSRAKRLTENVPKVTFEDVAGVEEAKSELEEVVEFLKNAKKFQALGAKIPKGVLLLGPPGCGKTMLARAIAGEAGVPFFHISGSDFVEMFVGVGASRVRDLFETAKANRPSLIFIDEIDAVGRQRGAGLGGGHDEREQTLNQLLVEMDGFDPNSGVIMIAATNRPDVLDPALLRPGRFDRHVTVDVPDAGGRRAILGVHLRGKPLADDVNVESLARRSPGFTGADLANLVNEAALLAARRDKTRVEMVDFNEAIDRVIAGPERKSRLLGEKEKEMVAYHELGHAIVGELLPLADPVHKVSILPRGRALGYTIHMPTEDKYLVTKSEFLDKIASILGGRVAEQLVYSEVTTGASNDFERATEMARAMVCQYGMSDKIGPLTIGGRHGNPFLGRDWMEERNYSDEVALNIDKEVRSIIDDCYERAKVILSENRDKMERVVKVLLEKESIERDEFVALMDGTEPAVNNQETPPTASAPPSDSKDAQDKPASVRPINLRPEPGVA